MKIYDGMAYSQEQGFFGGPAVITVEIEDGQAHVGKAMVTLIEGHLADALRWRDADEEPPSESGKKYQVRLQNGDTMTCTYYNNLPHGPAEWYSESADYGFENGSVESYRDFIPGIDSAEGL